MAQLPSISHHPGGTQLTPENQDFQSIFRVRGSSSKFSNLYISSSSFHIPIIENWLNFKSKPLSARRKNTIIPNVATSILRPSVKPGRTQESGPWARVMLHYQLIALPDCFNSTPVRRL